MMDYTSCLHKLMMYEISNKARCQKYNYLKSDKAKIVLSILTTKKKNKNTKMSLDLFFRLMKIH